MPNPKKPAHPLASVGGIAGAAGGYAVSHYAGPSLWIPGVATFLLFLLFTKTPLKPRYFVGAISITLGHVMWFLVAGILSNLWGAVGLDIVVLLLGVGWLWLRPGLTPALILGLVQLGSLAYNGYLISGHPIGSFEHKALTVHCLWRILAITALVVGYRNWRRDRNAAVLPPPIPEVG